MDKCPLVFPAVNNVNTLNVSPVTVDDDVLDCAMHRKRLAVLLSSLNLPDEIVDVWNTNTDSGLRITVAVAVIAAAAAAVVAAVHVSRGHLL